jgi:uncharacterized protein (TIGR00299 family) protein
VDAAGGASGDMLAGAMLDLGWPLEELEQLIAELGLSKEVKVSLAHPVHSGITSSRLHVEVLSANHHIRISESHHHRHLHDIITVLSSLPSGVSARAIAVFQRLARAEAKVHGVDMEEINFHEVGAVDSIVDIVAFCAALNWLQPDQIICSPLPLGSGFIDCAHGMIPLPAPAVVELLKDVPVHSWPEQAETVTPTGAALLVSTADAFGPLPAFSIRKIGTGGGSRLSQIMPNILRLLWGENALPFARDVISELTCNLDDYNPEDIPLLYELLFNAGALDVAAVNLLMKKNRPGLQLQVICATDTTEKLAAILLSQGSSLGVRVENKERRILAREIFTLATPWGQVRIKKVDPGTGMRFHPEAEDVLNICRATGLNPLVVRQKILAMVAECES